MQCGVHQRGAVKRAHDTEPSQLSQLPRTKIRSMPNGQSPLNWRFTLNTISGASPRALID